jgi:DNA-binding CsgD family transcriptional regulator
MMSTLNSKIEQFFYLAVDTMREHKDEILHEWTQMNFRFQNKQGPLYSLLLQDSVINQYAQIVSMLKKHIFEVKEINRYKMFTDLQSEWNKTFPEGMDHHAFIIIFTFLEKAAHEKIPKIHQKHQAIQYFFSELIMKLLGSSFYPLAKADIHEYLMQEYLHQLLQYIPLNWIARIHRQEKKYRVKEFLLNEELLKVDSSWIDMIRTLEADTIDFLEKAVFRLLHSEDVSSKDKKVLMANIEDEAILFCANKEDDPVISRMIRLLCHMFKINESVTLSKMNESNWKDAVIFFDEWLMSAKTFEETVERIGSGFVKYLPFERCAVFSYIQEKQVMAGLFGYAVDDQEIKKIEESIYDIPPVMETVVTSQPVYVEDASSSFPKKYVQQFQLESLVIAPLYAVTKDLVLGGVILDQGEGKQFKIDGETVTALLKMCQHAGEHLLKYWHEPERSTSFSYSQLSAREKEVLKLIASGYSIKEVAAQLYLSEYTVRDYVASAIKKLESKNRAHAIAKAIKYNII